MNENIPPPSNFSHLSMNAKSLALAPAHGL